MIIHSFWVLEVLRAVVIIIIIIIIIREWNERSGDALLTEFWFCLGHQDRIIATFSKSN
jgi:hypothetical protein